MMKDYENKSLEFGNLTTAQIPAFGGLPVFGGFGAANQQSPLFVQSTGSTSLFDNPTATQTPAFGGGRVFGTFGATDQQSDTSHNSEVVKPTNPFAEIALPVDKHYKLALLGTTRAKPKPWTPSPSEKSKPLFENTGTANEFRCGSLFDQPTQNQSSSLFGKSLGFETTSAAPVFNFDNARTTEVGKSLLGQNNQQKDTSCESEVLKLTNTSAENSFLNDNQHKLTLLGSIKVKPKPWTPFPNGKTFLFDDLEDEEPNLGNVVLLLKRIMNELVLKNLGTSRSKFVLTSDIYEKSDPVTKVEFCISMKISDKISSKIFVDTTSNSVPLTVDISDMCVLEISGSHFKKEVLQQLVTEFIKEYYNPCPLFSSDNTSQSSERKKESDEVTDDKDNSDDVDAIIIYIKLHKYKKDTVNAETEERLKVVQKQEEMIEHCKKEELHQSIGIQVPSESPELKFRELTPEMEEEIDKALHDGEPDEQLCKITLDSSSYYLLRKDIGTLKRLQLLNDMVINSYFDLIVKRSKQEGYPSVYAYNSFFYSTYKAKGYPSVKQWTRKIDIFSYDLNFVAVHMALHWGLAVIDHRSKKVCYYDSLSLIGKPCLDLLHQYLCLEYRDKKGEILDPNIYVTKVMEGIPRQVNGSDCGVFTLKYAEYISRDAEITFSQSHTDYFRRRMVYELLHSQLL